MNITPLFKTVYQTMCFVTPRIMSMKPLTNIITNMCNRQYLHSLSGTCINKLASPSFLQPSTPMYNSICGMKVKTVLHRRCKFCVMYWKNDRKYVVCKAKPRHNQAERKPAPYKTWILTHACQKPVREW